MKRVIDLIKKNELESISVLLSLAISAIAFIVYVAVWQNTINLKVAASSESISAIQQQLTSIEQQLNTISAKTDVNLQETQDIQSQVTQINQKTQ